MFRVVGEDKKSLDQKKVGLSGLDGVGGNPKRQAQNSGPGRPPPPKNRRKSRLLVKTSRVNSE